MGAVNYKTGEFITMALEPIDRVALEDEIKKHPENYDLSEDDLEDDIFINNFMDEFIAGFYDGLSSIADKIVDENDYDYFKVKCEPGYYEGIEVTVDPDFYTQMDDEDRELAIKEAGEIKKLLKALADNEFVSCTPGWSTGYRDYAWTLKDIDAAYDKMVQAIDDTGIKEQVNIRMTEASSVYLAKLNQFLDGQPKETVQFVKNALNAIFMGIKKDFNGYQEGKRPTIKNYGSYQVFSMVLQAIDDVKKDSNDQKGKWNFHDPVKDYCSHLGKIFNKKINGSTYTCVAPKIGDTENARYGSEYENATSQANYPMVGVYSTGIGGSYKNLNKELPGTTYSVIVSVPDILGDKYTNPNMSQSGNHYVFSNDVTDSQGRTYTVSFDMGDEEFVIKSSEPDSYDTFTSLYSKSRGSLKAFKELVNKFNSRTTEAEVDEILKNNGVKLKHSWVFNPYID